MWHYIPDLHRINKTKSMHTYFFYYSVHVLCISSIIYSNPLMFKIVFFKMIYLYVFTLYIFLLCKTLQCATPHRNCAPPFSSSTSINHQWYFHLLKWDLVIYRSLYHFCPPRSYSSHSIAVKHRTELCDIRMPPVVRMPPGPIKTL